MNPIKLNSNEVMILFKESPKKHYKKKGVFLVRPAVEGETYFTIVSGKLETMKTAGPNEMVVKNVQIGSSAEHYITSKAHYEKSYTLTGDTCIIDGKPWNFVEAKGEVFAFPFVGQTITFDAPWGEAMLCNEGDFIASPVGGKETDIYRIEKETFEQTYSEYTPPVPVEEIKQEESPVKVYKNTCCEECGEGYDNEEDWTHLTECPVCGHPKS